MHTEELVVEQCRDGQRMERADTCLIDRHGVLVEALALEGEVLCEMSAFVVTPQ